VVAKLKKNSTVEKRWTIKIRGIKTTIKKYLLKDLLSSHTRTVLRLT
jgi:hypothetical protein